MVVHLQKFVVAQDLIYRNEGLHQLQRHLSREQELMRHYPDKHTKPASIQEGHCPLCIQGIGHTSGRGSPNM